MLFARSVVVSLLVTSSLAFEAEGMGLAAAQPTAVLGQALDFAVNVRLDAGETLTSSCVRAEVMQGDALVPSPLVVAAVERATAADDVIVRVRTGVAIQEPVVSVQLSLGCPTRVMRRYTLLADPPTMLAQAQPGWADAGPSSVTAVAPAGEPALPVNAAPVEPVAPAASLPAVATPARRPAAPRAPAATRRPAERAVAARPQKAQKPAAPARARLQLEPVEPPPEVLVAQAQAAVAEAAASAAAAAASAAEARLRDMEATVAQLRKDAQADRLAVEQMRARLAESDAQAGWLPWLAGACALLAAACAGLAWRLRQATAARPAWWHSEAPEDAVAIAVDEPAPSRGDVAAAAAMVPPPTAAAPALARVPFDASATSPTVLLSPTPFVAPTPAPAAPADPAPEPAGPWDDVTVEEQIDLEQQVDFFVVLGQEDSAIDLLLTHLRRTGGTAPMPYLKLLELHRRRGEREAYDRMRDRFNQRFNGVAPAWEHDPASSRQLEDYPAAVQRLQRLWPQPLDAMAGLESMLFRRGNGAELFDLPAYHDVLFLYQIARELRQPRVGAPTDVVDVLLPIGDPEDSMFAVDGGPTKAPAAGGRHRGPGTRARAARRRPRALPAQCPGGPGPRPAGRHAVAPLTHRRPPPPRAAAVTPSARLGRRRGRRGPQRCEVGV